MAYLSGRALSSAGPLWVGYRRAVPNFPLKFERRPLYSVGPLWVCYRALSSTSH